MPRQNLTSGSAFEAQISYSRAVVIDDLIMTSGTTGYDYRTGEISSDIAEQAEQALVNIESVLKEAGFEMSDIMHARYILPDRDEFPKVWPVLQKWFGDIRPAATMWQSALMKEEMKIEIEVTAKRSGPINK